MSFQKDAFISFVRCHSQTLIPTDLAKEEKLPQKSLESAHTSQSSPGAVPPKHCDIKCPPPPPQNKHDSVTFHESCFSAPLGGVKRCTEPEGNRASSCSFWRKDAFLWPCTLRPRRDTRQKLYPGVSPKAKTKYRVGLTFKQLLL